jgi:hypothetical protein
MVRPKQDFVNLGIAVISNAHYRHKCPIMYINKVSN